MAGPSSDPWAIREADYPARGPREEQLQFALRYAILAPSARNMQPWRFGVGRDQITLRSDVSRWQQVSDPHERELHVSLGCALENLLIALEHFGFGHHVSHFPGGSDGSIVAQVAILDRPVASKFRPSNLFGAITQRRTNHGNYRKRAIAPVSLRKLMDCRADGDLTLMLTQEPVLKATIDRLVVLADAITLSDPDYRDELAECIGAGSFGGPWLLSVARQFALAHLGRHSSGVKGDAEAVASAPVFGLIGGKIGDKAAHVKCGQLLERLYLSATAQRLCLQPVSQLLEADETRTKFSKLFRAGGVPLLPFRLGYADPPARPTPRRPLEQVLV
jgi:hypothetical protein